MKAYQLRFFLIVGLLLGVSSLRAQPICEPDTTLDSLGVYPSTPPPATVGQFYEVTLDAAIPKSIEVDFNGQPLNASICQARILGTDPDITSMGLTFDCNVPDCEINIDHTEAQDFAFACIVISGTPDTLLDSVKVLLKADVGTVNAGVCNTLLTLDTSLVVGLRVVEDTTTTSAAQASLPEVELGAHVDPTREQLSAQLELSTAGTYQLEVVDLAGRPLTRRSGLRLEAGSHRVNFSTATWPSGLYLLRLRSEARTRTAKVLLQR
jgi:hypothetical protein